MQLSIGKLATILIALFITVTLVTTGAGLYVLQTNYRSLENRQEAEAHDTLRNATIAVRSQVRFYQGILELISANPEVSNLLEFADTPEITNWSFSLGRLLPGTLGTALASPDGVVFGDPLALRVGPACQADMRHFAKHGSIAYPLLHTDIPGLEHFDLITKLSTASGEPLGTLFVSFRLSIIEELLRSMTHQGDRFALFDSGGTEKLATGEPAQNLQIREYRAKIPDTSWELALRRPIAPPDTSLTALVIVDALSLVGVGILIVFLVRTTLSRFTSDMSRIHTALVDVLAGRYRPAQAPTALKETAILMPDIEQLALRIQRQRDDLRQQSLSDPLTGVFNRRYFDLMLAHLHEQSRRQAPATLVVVDLNDFKHVNDEFGHPSGDRVLQNAARFLRSRVRASDIVARLGGDEFALLLTHMSKDNLEEWLTALIHDYDHQLLDNAQGEVSFCQFSIGAASVDAAIFPTPGDVVDAADGAMYAVKQRRQVRHSRFAVARPDAASLKTAAAKP